MGSRPGSGYGFPGSPQGSAGSTGLAFCWAASEEFAGAFDHGALSSKWVGGLSKSATRPSQPPTTTTTTAATATKNMIWLRAEGP